MSHSENYTDTGRTTVFYDGMQYGVEKERERILKIIADYRNKPSFGYANLISLIKGEQE